MHENQIHLDAEGAAALIAEQFPRWRHLPVQRVTSHGTVNMLFRLGTEFVARFPLEPGELSAKRAWIAREAQAAHHLRTFSPVPTPEPVALGEPGRGYPLPWAVYRWLPGTIAGAVDAAHVAAHVPFAQDLAGFVAALRAEPTGGRTFAGTGRGGLLPSQDAYVASALARSEGLIDTAALAALWSRVRSTPRTGVPDVWTHGDLMPGNVLTSGGRLAGVIDVGGLAPADPALDLMPAWNLLLGPAREAFRVALAANQDEWERSKGWALAQAIGCLWYYQHTNPVMSRTAHHTLHALLEAESLAGPGVDVGGLRQTR